MDIGQDAGWSNEAYGTRGNVGNVEVEENRGSTWNMQVRQRSTWNVLVECSTWNIQGVQGTGVPRETLHRDWLETFHVERSGL